MGNKVEFGISNLHIGTYSVATDGTVTLGSAYHQPGAVSFSPEANDENNTFYADDIAYWSDYDFTKIEGDLEVAKFSDEFKTQFLNYVAKTDGGIALVKGKTKPNVYIGFEVKGDVEKRRIIMYNVSLGSIKRSYNTIEENKEVATETIAVTVAGDNATGVTKVGYRYGTTGYNTVFTNPPVPSTT